MTGFVADIEGCTEDNHDFRRVLYTGLHMQLVVMSLLPGEEIGEEVHEDTDEFLRVEDGRGEICVDGHVSPIESDVAVLVPAGARHNIRNVGRRALKLYTLSAPAEYPEGTVHRTKRDVKTAGGT